MVTRCATCAPTYSPTYTAGRVVFLGVMDSFPRCPSTNALLCPETYTSCRW